MAVVEETLRAIEEELTPPRSPSPRPPDVRLQPPPRVPGVGVVTPAERPSAAEVPPARRERPRSLPLGQAALLGSLAVAVLFVLFVLPRLAEPPSPPPTHDIREGAPGPEEGPAPTPEIAADTTPRPAAPSAEAPPLPAEAPPVSAPPPPDPTPVAAPPPRRAEPARDADAERRAREQFAAEMSEAQAAFEREDWPTARQGLARAGALQPGSPAVVDLRRRIEARERAVALAAQRERARGSEAKEDWRRALAEYEAALKLDPAVAFALEGRERTARRAVLAEKLAYHVDHPLRLAADPVAREAEGLLQQAREIDSPGPRHRQQVAALERALVEVRTPVAVVLESDGETQVVVHKVGRLGAFKSKTLDLRPGTYTVVGTRSGYRDVRRQLVVKPAAAPPPVVVRCEEAI
jgi:hypothetical protein